MKKICIIAMLLLAVTMPLAGCATLGGGEDWAKDIPRLKADVFMFAKLATRITLNEADTPPEDVQIVEGYLVALKDLLAVPGQPNFAGARVLAGQRLPHKYQIYGLTIIDVLERYLRTAGLNVTEDQAAIIAIISAGIDGALEAVQEFKE